MYKDMENGIFGTVRQFSDFFRIFGHLRSSGIFIPPTDSFYATAGYFFRRLLPVRLRFPSADAPF